MHIKHWKVFAIALFIIFILGTAATGWAAAPVIEWSRTYGGSGSDSANAIQQTSDGGYIFVGSSNSNDGDVSGNRGGWDGWVVRLDAAGDIIWQRSLGGSGSDGFVSVQQTMEGGFIVAGDSSSTDGDVSGNRGGTSGWVVKLDADGEIEWQRTFGGQGTDSINDIQQTADGGYIFTGTSFSNLENLPVTWSSIFVGLMALLGFYDLSENRRPSHGPGSLGTDVWVVKLDTEGEFVWQRVFGASGVNNGRAIQQTLDGGYIIAADSISSDGNRREWNFWIIKLDAKGNITWQRSLSNSDRNSASAIQQTAGGGYIVVGTSSSNDCDVSGNRGDRSGWAVKLDADGEIEWQRSFAGAGIGVFNSVYQTTDGGYVIAGNSQNDGDVSGNRRGVDFWIVKLDVAGSLVWQKLLGGSGRDAATSIRQTSDGGYIVAGFSESNDGDVPGNRGESDIWIVKLNYESPARQ